MRASTVFILALALLIGLAVAAGAKSAGLFNSKPAVVAAPPPAPTVLVSKVNLFEDVAVTADQVSVRELRPHEEKALRDTYGEAWREKVMQPLASVAHLRVALKNIPADTILLRSHLSELALPPGQTTQLELNTRAVNVAVTKDKAAGGVVRVGEYVDVFLTTQVGVGDRQELRTAPIARACKIIMKRNIIWPLSIGDPDNKPLNFTLQANSYRAALIDYAQAHGQLSLFPVSPPLKTGGTFSDPSSTEYATEDQRIEEMARGRLTIGSDDLARIFLLVPPIPAAAKPPAAQPVRIPHLTGTQYSGVTTLPPPAPPTPTPPVKPAEGDNGAAPKGTGAEPGAPAPAYTFRFPDAARPAAVRPR